MRPKTGRFLVLGVVFVCAACGLVYKLELVALDPVVTRLARTDPALCGLNGHVYRDPG